jgi:hypothetical protein
LCSVLVQRLLESVLGSSAKALHKWLQNSPAIKLTKVLSIDDLFKGCHLDREIIVRSVRWY